MTQVSQLEAPLEAKNERDEQKEEEINTLEYLKELQQNLQGNEPEGFDEFLKMWIRSCECFEEWKAQAQKVQTKKERKKKKKKGMMKKAAKRKKHQEAEVKTWNELIKK